MKVEIPYRGYQMRPLVDMLNDHISRDDKEAVLLAIWTLRREDKMERDAIEASNAGCAP